MKRNCDLRLAAALAALTLLPIVVAQAAPPGNAPGVQIDRNPDRFADKAATGLGARAKATVSLSAAVAVGFNVDEPSDQTEPLEIARVFDLTDSANIAPESGEAPGQCVLVGWDYFYSNQTSGTGGAELTFGAGGNDAAATQDPPTVDLEGPAQLVHTPAGGPPSTVFSRSPDITDLDDAPVVVEENGRFLARTGDELSADLHAGFAISVPPGSSAVGDAMVAINTFVLDGPVDCSTLPVEISVGNASIEEGDDGIRSLRFPVSVSSTFDSPTVTVRVQDGSAVAGQDYEDLGPRTLRFLPGQPLTQEVVVPVYGDSNYESDESVMVVLSGPSQFAVLADASAVGVIRNDDVRADIPALGKTALAILVLMAGLLGLIALRR